MPTDGAAAGKDRSHLERATDENFDEARYLAANPDVARHVAAGADAWKHFERHGRREGRFQLTAAAVGLSGTRGWRKYQRLSAILDASRGDHDRFRFVAEPDAFPVIYGDTVHHPDDYDGEAANPGLGDFVDEVKAHPERVYLDVGCGRRSRTFDNCLYLDVYPSRSADLIMAPSCRYPIRDASVDGIGCFAVLEHVTEPWTVAAEFRRMLKPGGLLFVDFPFLVPVHGYPSHYYNATRAGLARLFADGFEQLSLATLDNQTPDHAIAWQLSGLAAAITDEVVRSELLARSVASLLAEPPGSDFWKRVLATIPRSARETYAAGNTLIARRR